MNHNKILGNEANAIDWSKPAKAAAATATAMATVPRVPTTAVIATGAKFPRH